MEATGVPHLSGRFFLFPVEREERPVEMTMTERRVETREGDLLEALPVRIGNFPMETQEPPLRAIIF